MSPIRVRIRELRDKKGWSQQKLGEEAGVRQATISELETGVIQRADFSILERLAIALGVEPGELLEREAKRATKKTEIRPSGRR